MPALVLRTRHHRLDKDPRPVHAYFSSKVSLILHLDLSAVLSANQLVFYLQEVGVVRTFYKC